MKGLGEIMMITWAGFGLRIDNMNETPDSLTVYISVPEHSYQKNSDGEEMAGMVLARRYKTVMTEMGVKRLTVKSKIRVGEHWTKEMSDAAELEMKKTIYGSQH